MVSQNNAVPNITINNTTTSSSSATATATANGGHAKNKWVAFFLCLFIGFLGAHKFYEGKTMLGILYFCTAGLCGIGWLKDIISLFFKPNPYYV